MIETLVGAALLLGGGVLLVVIADSLRLREAKRNADAERYLAERPGSDPSLDVTGQSK